MRAAVTTLIVLGVLAVVVYVALRGPDYAPVRYVPLAAPVTAVVSGRAVDGAGRPVADVALTWYSAVESQGGSSGATMFRGDDTGVRTAADGTFRLERLRGEVGYVAVGSAEAVREGETALVRLRAGFNATELELRVVEVPLARRVQGTVLHGDGTPAASVTVLARRESWRGTWQESATTDASGVFELVAPWAGGECELVLWGSDDSKLPLGTFPVGSRGHTLRVP